MWCVFTFVSPLWSAPSDNQPIYNFRSSLIYLYLFIYFWMKSCALS